MQLLLIFKHYFISFLILLDFTLDYIRFKHSVKHPILNRELHQITDKNRNAEDKEITLLPYKLD